MASTLNLAQACVFSQISCSSIESVKPCNAICKATNKALKSHKVEFTSLAARSNGLNKSFHFRPGAGIVTRAGKVAPTVAIGGLFKNFGGGGGSSKLKTVIITGASSGLGLSAARVLIEGGEHHVVLACRNVAKMQEVAEVLEFPNKLYTIMELELTSLASVRQFVNKFRKTNRTLDCLCCNAAIYLPNQPAPTYTEDGFEESVGVNHLSHFLLVNLMLKDLQKSKEPRCIIVGSITGNRNTVGGGAVKPFADLGNLEGLEGDFQEPTCMIDGEAYDGAKAYKDSKLANMMTVLELHKRYHESTGITFTSLYPGCIAESALFRQKRAWFRNFFPIFMKYVTGGYVSIEESGERLAQCITSPETLKSGVYWSWNGGARTVGVYNPLKGGVVGAGGSGGELFENLPSTDVSNPKRGAKLWDLSSKLVGL
mmetsp:Transcript_35273/g.48962  ORF Transcript_35273/g.48962 Transcript_35273/m.48962 type:complete len:427 (+) Transcript_35273:83-1363(+)|eukprot:CAMPEP_0196571246 /NCGR_PEP_ID=MMETSP1081-20130531/1431_1 /TAXON_ID=36882 /ORGANISM="Pyramimonas amylifera, Strain CCMP720" /LENGTH=426 /DNA_ID=CAMNT_0041888113 /DNA_START=48 /DNA_END=1328 /DNA_ORIENTATION=+